MREWGLLFLVVHNGRQYIQVIMAVLLRADVS